MKAIIVHHGQGEEIFAGESEEKVFKRLEKYCRYWWEQDEEAPIDQNKLIEEYFALKEDQEWWELRDLDEKDGEEGEYDGDEGSFYTTPFFWDCECESDYIHPKDHDSCETCGAMEEDSPDSRLNEVIKYLEETAEKH